MKGLSTLVRLHRSRLDETRVRLAGLENMRGDFCRRHQSLGDELANESDCVRSSPQSAWSYAAYRESVEARRDRLNASIAEIEAEMITVKEALSAAFREYKKHEVVLERRTRELESQEQRRMRIVEVVLCIVMHRRVSRDAT